MRAVAILIGLPDGGATPVNSVAATNSRGSRKEPSFLSANIIQQ
jgi:hypothetical protein